MALVRILVDGYSLLHGWPAPASGKPRHSAAARDEVDAAQSELQRDLHRSNTRERRRFNRAS